MTYHADLPHTPNDAFIAEYNAMLAGDPYADIDYLADAMTTYPHALRYVQSDPNPTEAYRFMFGRSPERYDD